jgi:type VI secretion system protein ImpL
VTEYTIEIDGQQLRYRNTPSTWTNMVHPGPQGVSGARISAVTFDGRTVELFSAAGEYGLRKMIDAATRQRKDGGVFALRWSSGNVAVAVDLKLISSPEANGSGDTATASRGFHNLRLPETIVGHSAPQIAHGASSGATPRAGVPAPAAPAAAAPAAAALGATTPGAASGASGAAGGR